MNNIRALFRVLISSMGLSFVFTACSWTTPAPPVIEGPVLQMNGPLDCGESPQGIRTTKTFLLKNVGSSGLEVRDMTIETDEAVFQADFTIVGQEIERLETYDLAITFTPQAEKLYEAKLHIHYNGEGSPAIIDIKGLGVSNLVCESCSPPPATECSRDGVSSIRYEATSSDSCSSEAGICAYLMFETVCEDGVCDASTGTCPETEPFDAGPGDPCENRDCGANSRCEAEDGEAICLCDAGFERNSEDTQCEDTNECQNGTANCDANASCENTEGSFSCLCNSGYSGDGTNCSDEDECTLETDNCDANATCENISGSFRCSCNAGYFGDGTACEDVDECALEAATCDENATCENTLGAFTCACNEGYRGDGQQCEDIDECAEELNNCDLNATCTNTPGAYNCVCDWGYAGDGTVCSDVDECGLDMDDCAENATCTNTAGSFSCECNAGYNGDGTACTDDDECALETDNCDANAACTNTAGSFTCECNAGYSGDGTACTDDDECALETDNCDANAACTNTAGSFACACDEGYSGDGTACTDDDECTLGTDNCGANATCSNSAGSFSCACDEGYSGDGVSCEDINECDSMETYDCPMFSTCTNEEPGYACTCNEGYAAEGDACVDEDGCVAHACPAACIDIPAPGTGHLCDDDSDGFANENDNCPDVPNVNQDNLDNDNEGDVCDPDADGDLVLAEDDCDDFDASSTTLAEDPDCDGFIVPDLPNKSLRFNKNQNMALTRTAANASNGTQFTYSVWTKTVNGEARLMTSGDDSTYTRHDGISISNGKLIIGFVRTYYVVYIESESVIASDGEWVNVVIYYDMGQGTPTDRIKAFVNGSPVNMISKLEGQAVSSGNNTAWGSSGLVTYLGNNQYPSHIGRSYGYNSVQYFDQYLYNPVFVDGQALPEGLAHWGEAFGEDNNQGGWIPKRYEGPYGTNGFQLTFEDELNPGVDYNDGPNSWVSLNVAPRDLFPDTPIHNFAVLDGQNPGASGVYGGGVISNANLTNSGNTPQFSFNDAMSTVGAMSGKYYVELYVQAHSGFTYSLFGTRTKTGDDHSVINFCNQTYSANTAASGAGGQTGLGTVDNGDVIGLTFDLDASPQSAQYYLNGNPWGGPLEFEATESTFVRIAATTSQNGIYVPTYVMNFGQDPTFNGHIDTEGQAPENGIGRFYFEPPAGYQALVETTLLPCQGDSDCDGVLNTGDNCAYQANTAQLDLDDDGLGDACDPDADDDGTLSENDCDDLDANSTIRPEDEDCDGVLSVVDCNDFDASVTLSLTEDPLCGAMRSLRLSEDHQTYLERTFGPSVDDRKKTFSWWQKRTVIDKSVGHPFTGNAQASGGGILIYGSGASGAHANDLWGINDRTASSGDSDFWVTTAEPLTDVTVWTHHVVVVDTTLAEPSDRVQLYENGTRLTGEALQTELYPPQDYEMIWYGSNSTNYIGYGLPTGSPHYYDGYLADYYYIDGEALTPQNFAHENAQGNWAPLVYDMADAAGNSFHLAFEEDRSAMAPAIPGAALSVDSDNTHTLIHSDTADGDTTVTDATGNLSWGTNGDFQHTTGNSVFGASSMSFDGSNDYLRANSSWWHLRGNWNGTARTVELWFNTDSDSYQTLVSQSSNQHYAHLWIRPDCVHTRNDCMGFNTNQGGATPSAAVPISLNEWHHIAHVITADSQSYLFFDGELVDERPWTNPNAFDGSENMQIGAQTYQNTSIHRYPFSGHMDEIRFSTGALYLPAAASGVGKDASALGNHFTAYNLGAKDVVWDSPVTNFAVMDVNNQSVLEGYTTFSEGNTKIYSSKANNKIFSTLSSGAGKYYVEAMVHSNGFQYMGVAPEAYVANVDDYTGYLTQNNPHVWALYNSDTDTDGKVYHDGVAQEDLGTIEGYTVVHLAVDVNDLKVYFGMNGTWSGDPVAGTGGHDISDDRWYFAQGYRDWVTWNFGQDATFAGELVSPGYGPYDNWGRFHYEPPAGYRALLTASTECQGNCLDDLGTEAQPASTCSSLHEANPLLPSGAYWLDPDGAGVIAAYEAYCDMETDGGGWTLVGSWDASATIDETQTMQTMNCAEPETFCNMTELGWQTVGYNELMHAWTGCPGAYGASDRASHENDSGACTNTEDSLNLTAPSVGCSATGGLKVWNDCGCVTGGQTRLMAGYGGGPTFWTSSHYIQDSTGLSTSSGAAGVVNYTCDSGHSNLFVR